MTATRLPAIHLTGDGTGLVDALSEFFDTGTGTGTGGTGELGQFQFYDEINSFTEFESLPIPRADENGHVPPSAGELKFPRKIGNPRSAFKQIFIKNCPKGRLR